MRTDCMNDFLRNYDVGSPVSSLKDFQRMWDNSR